MIIAQFSDAHVGADGAMADHLARAITTIAAFDPDWVLASGDLVRDGTAADYETFVALTESIADRLLVVPGNHDIPTEMMGRFPATPVRDDRERFDWRLDDHLTMIGLDTTIPGEHGGQITDDQLAWLDTQLADTTRPALIVQHHPPFDSAMMAFNTMGLANAEAEADVISRHPQVCAVLCGHLHRPVMTRVGGTVAMSCPPTSVQFGLDLTTERLASTEEPPAVAIHVWSDRDGLRSHLVTTR